MNLLYEEKFVNDFEYKIYQDLFTEDIVEKYYPTEILYLDASVKTCSERIIKRKRDGEQNINDDYLKKCESKYIKWITSGDINYSILGANDGKRDMVGYVLSII
jgi:deoxyadenosine/deoxycytidine kinase